MKMENDIRFADLRHPADLMDELDPTKTAEPGTNQISNGNDLDEANPGGDNAPRQLAAEVIRKVFQWAADSKTLDECGFRTFVALACIRPDLFDGVSLAELGLRHGRQRQAVFNLKEKFRRETGIEPLR